MHARGLLLPFQICHPYVSGDLAHGEGYFVAGHGDLQPVHTDIQQAASRTMGVIYGERRSRSALRGRVETLRPEASETVPIGDEVKEVAVRGPSRIGVKGGAVGNRHPLLSIGG